MQKFKITHPVIIEKIAKNFVGDEIIPFPKRSGSKLVEFFNEMGYSDIYGVGFPTKWRYATEKIKSLISENRFSEFILKTISLDELIKFESELKKPIIEIQMDIINQMNNNIFKLTDYEIVGINRNIKFIKKEPLKCIGGGYFANVYVLEKNKKKYALKKLKDEFHGREEYKHRIKREYEIMQMLNESQYCIKVFDYINIEYAFEMELADCNLKEFIEKNNHIMNESWKEAIAEEVILGMIDLHKTTIHRDLSYNNILMIDSHPKLADFGLGKDLTKLYSYGTVSEKEVGTPHFTDPIQKQNLKNANFQTDIYSLGMIIDYIFCGSIVSEEHKYSSIVNNSIHKDLDRRYKTVEELYTAFIGLKNSNYKFDPVSDLINMKKNNKFSSEKIYMYFIREDSGDILFNLILKDYEIASEFVIFFYEQYSHEIEKLIEKMYVSFENERMQFQDYDKFGYFSINTIIEIGKVDVVTKILSEIVKYCAFDVNRYNIHKKIDNNKSNNRIPYEFRSEWQNRN